MFNESYYAISLWLLIYGPFINYDKLFDINEKFRSIKSLRPLENVNVLIRVYTKLILLFLEEKRAERCLVKQLSKK